MLVVFRTFRRVVAAGIQPVGWRLSDRSNGTMGDCDYVGSIQRDVRALRDKIEEISKGIFTAKNGTNSTDQ